MNLSYAMFPVLMCLVLPANAGRYDFYRCENSDGTLEYSIYKCANSQKQDRIKDDNPPGTPYPGQTFQTIIARVAAEKQVVTPRSATTSNSANVSSVIDRCDRLVSNHTGLPPIFALKYKIKCMAALAGTIDTTETHITNQSSGGGSPSYPSQNSGGGSSSYQAPVGVINNISGQYMPPVAGGVINPTSGTFYPQVAGGYINSKTGQFVPSH